MLQTINDLKLYYQIYGEGKPLVLLHGWGGEGNSFFPVIQEFKKDHAVYAIDLPGFGQSDNPPRPFSVADYAQTVREFLERLGLEQVVLMGHSFGGRIAVKLAASPCDRIEKLILVSPAGLKPQKTAKQLLYYTLAKTGKVVFSLPGLSYFQKRAKDALYEKVGEDDYRHVHGVMKQTFLAIIREDLGNDAARIKIPTLLIWGRNDEAVPLEDGKRMAHLIKNATFDIFNNAGHFVFLDLPDHFCTHVREFLNR